MKPRDRHLRYGSHTKSSSGVLAKILVGVFVSSMAVAGMLVLAYDDVARSNADSGVETEGDDDPVPSNETSKVDGGRGGVDPRLCRPGCGYGGSHPQS